MREFDTTGKHMYLVTSFCQTDCTLNRAMPPLFDTAEEAILFCESMNSMDQNTMWGYKLLSVGTYLEQKEEVYKEPIRKLTGSICWECGGPEGK